MKKQIKAPAIVTIAVLTVITVVFWIGFETFRLVTKKPEAPVPPEIIAPLNPTLDANVITKLQQRVYLKEEEIGNIIITKVSEEPASSPEPQEGGSSTSTPAATAAGQIDTTGTQ